MKLIIVDWAGYPLFREKSLRGGIFSCGIGAALENINKHKAGVAFSVVLVINEPSKANQVSYEGLLNKYGFIEKLIFRSNIGYDFGAYNCGYRYLKNINYDGDVVFMNSCVNGPYEDNWLSKYRDLFHAKRNVGICGASVNSHTLQFKRKRLFRPHIQSFFIYTSMKVLRKAFANNLPGAYIRGDKVKLITKGEIGLSQNILDCGYSICCTLFKNFFYSKNSAWNIPFKSYRHETLNKI